MDLIDKYLGEKKCPEGEKFWPIKKKCVPVGTGMNEAKGSKTQMECMECGHKFKKKIGKKTIEVKCPKCGGYDTDVA